MTNIAETVKAALGEVQNMADSQTIVGDPIKVGETTLIPVSKVSIGVGIGGGTYGKASDNNAGAGGTGLTVSPIAFIVVSKNGEVSMLNIGADTPMGGKISGTVSEIDKALDNIPDIISKVKGILGKDKKAEEVVVEETITTTVTQE